MKKIFWIASIFTVACFSSYGQDNSDDSNNDDVYYQDDDNTAPAPATDASQDAPTYQQFYDQLSPYGQWINYPGYGYCWVPNQVPGDFSPYMTAGHWVYTDYGMTWVSDYAWGWGPFHYGRWFMDDSYGWMWVPGYDWGPSWCMWGEYGGYYCWAPFGPGVIISPHYRPDPRYWHFVDHGHIMDPHIDHYGVKSEVVAGGFHGNVADLNNHISFNTHAGTYNQGVFFSGPKAEEIQHYTGHPVTKVAINNSAKAGATHVEGNQLNIYRPAIQRTSKQPAPSNAKNAQDVHPANNRENTQPQRNSEPAAPARSTQHAAQQPAQQRQVQPERNFIPSERPESAPQRSAPAPSYRGGSAPAPSFHGGGGGGGGFHGGGGGGRH